MTIIVDGFELLQTLEIPSITGTANNTPVMFKYNEFDAGTVAKLRSDGGDLRISTTTNLLNSRLALHIDSGSFATSDIKGFVKLSTVETGLILYVWGNKPAATQPANTAQFGRDETYSNELRYWGLNEQPSAIEDYTGNSSGYTSVLTGITSATVAGNVGLNFNSQTVQRYIDFGSIAGLGKNITLQTAVYTGVGGNAARTIFSSKDAAEVNCQIIFFNNRIYATHRNTSTGGNVLSSSIPLNQWVYITQVVNNNSNKLYIDGVEVDELISSAFTVNQTGITNQLGAMDTGAQQHVNNLTDCTVDYVSLRDSSKTATEIAIEYSNLSSVSPWFIAGAAPTPAINNKAALGSITRLSQNGAILLEDLSMTEQTRLFFTTLLQELTERSLLFGTGSPEGLVSAKKGQTYQDDAGAAGTIRYAKSVDNINGDDTKGWVLI